MQRNYSIIRRAMAFQESKSPPRMSLRGIGASILISQRDRRSNRVLDAKSLPRCENANGKGSSVPAQSEVASGPELRYDLSGHLGHLGDPHPVSGTSE